MTVPLASLTQPVVPVPTLMSPKTCSLSKGALAPIPTFPSCWMVNLPPAMLTASTRKSPNPPNEARVRGTIGLDSQTVVPRIDHLQSKRGSGRADANRDRRSRC